MPIRPRKPKLIQIPAPLPPLDYSEKVKRYKLRFPFHTYVLIETLTFMPFYAGAADNETRAMSHILEAPIGRDLKSRFIRRIRLRGGAVLIGIHDVYRDQGKCYEDEGRLTHRIGLRKENLGPLLNERHGGAGPRRDLREASKARH